MGKRLVTLALTVGLLSTPLGAVGGATPTLAGEHTATAQLVTVPNVVGKPVRQAGSLILRAGLRPQLFGSGDTIVDQSPNGGDVVPAGSYVSLFKGNG